jgi:glycine betaine catabolism B
MIKRIDNFLDGITMYRLALYYLIFLLGAAIALAAAGVLRADPFALLFTTGFLVGACVLSNWIMAKAFGVPANAESTYISALILALIIAPLQSYRDLWFLGWAAVWAMASKYIVAINRKHLFNPVAFAVALTYLTINQSANWWVGSAAMLPFVVFGGVLVVRKIRRFDVTATFVLVAVATAWALSLFNGDDAAAALQHLVLDSPLVFFACVFITEPLTLPATRSWRLWYAALVGFLFAPEVHVGGFFTTPELALLLGNVFSYLVSPKANWLLTLKAKIQVAPDVWDFIFVPARKMAFAPGQYMEWTLAHDDPDERGNRRYFTLASSPTEANVRVGVKFYQNSSSLKQALLAMSPQDEIMASHLAGDFVLPKDPRQKCVFIAGGIGVTPFRSMIQYLIDMHEWRPIVLFYANRTAREIVYKNVFDQAQQVLGIKTVYTLTNQRDVPASWRGKVGHITPQMIKAEVPDYSECYFYVSGPTRMVNSMKDTLHWLGVRDSHIKTDFFSGLA